MYGSIIGYALNSAFHIATNVCEPIHQQSTIWNTHLQSQSEDKVEPDADLQLSSLRITLS